MTGTRATEIATALESVHARGVDLGELRVPWVFGRKDAFQRVRDLHAQAVTDARRAVALLAGHGGELAEDALILRDVAARPLPAKFDGRTGHSLGAQLRPISERMLRAVYDEHYTADPAAGVAEFERLLAQPSIDRSDRFRGRAIGQALKGVDPSRFGDLKERLRDIVLTAVHKEFDDVTKRDLEQLALISGLPTEWRSDIPISGFGMISAGQTPLSSQGRNIFRMLRDEVVLAELNGLPNADRMRAFDEVFTMWSSGVPDGTTAAFPQTLREDIANAQAHTLLTLMRADGFAQSLHEWAGSDAFASKVAVDTSALLERIRTEHRGAIVLYDELGRARSNLQLIVASRPETTPW